MPENARTPAGQNPWKCVAVITCSLLAAGSASADTTAHYLANEGVMVVSNETKILFDPLFREGFGIYQTLPAELEAALMAGDPPFDGIDAMFISHYHDDHFSPLDVLEYLHNHPDVQLFAPEQATRVLLSLAGDERQSIADRVTSLDIDHGDAPVDVEFGSLDIEAFHVPHSGWPQRRPEVQNLVYRVTLDDDATVVHMGDADARTAHFESDAPRWTSRTTHMAFPPYWFYLSIGGRQALDLYVQPLDSVGVHVPMQLDAPTTEALGGRTLFRTPGETRTIPGGD